MLKVRFSGLKHLFYASVVAFFLIGCSSKTFVGRAQWVQNGINDIKVDGIVQDWPKIPPLYYDEDNRMSVQMVNDNEALYIYLSVAGKDLKKGAVKDGLTLTLEPVKLAISPLKITFKDHQHISVLYPSEFDSGMISMVEVREKGIEAEMNQPNEYAMVFEARIRFDAIDPPAGILPGTKLTLKIESKKMKNSEGISSEKSGGRSGGGKGGAGGKGGGRSEGMRSAGKRENMMEPFEAILELVLATDPL